MGDAPLSDLSARAAKMLEPLSLNSIIDEKGSFQVDTVTFAASAILMSLIPLAFGYSATLSRNKREYAPHGEFLRGWTLPQPSWEYSDDSSYTSYHVGPESYQDVMMSAVGRQEPVRSSKKDGLIEESMLKLTQDLFMWSRKKLEHKKLISALVDLGVSKVTGQKNPADKLVEVAYEKWKRL